MELGTYRHYKGTLIEVLGVAIHSETLEELVVYRVPKPHNGYPSGSLWVRPQKMFIENVIVDGKEVPRFSRITN